MCIIAVQKLQKWVERLYEAVGVHTDNNAISQDFLTDLKSFIGGIVIFTDGISQTQIAGRVTGIVLGSLSQSQNRYLEIDTDIPFNTEERKKKESNGDFHAKEIVLFDFQKPSEYVLSFQEEREIFTIARRERHVLITLVTKTMSDEFLAGRKKYCDEYVMNTLGW